MKVAIYFALAGVALVYGTPSFSQKRLAPVRTAISDPTALNRFMEIAGVYWGQPEAEAVQALQALQALQARGYDVDNSKRQDQRSYEEQIIKGPGLYRFDSDTYTLDGRAQDQSIVVELRSFSDGWRVESAQYFYRGGRAPQQIAEAARRKYAAAGLRVEPHGGACRPAPAKCDAYPHITFHVWSQDFDMRLLLGDAAKSFAVQDFQNARRRARGEARPNF